MKVEFSPQDRPQDWLQAFADEFGMEITDNAFEIPANIGKGFVKHYYFFEGFTLTYIKFLLFEDLKFIRHSAENAQLFPIMFFGQDTPMEQDIDEQKKHVGFHTSNGIFMPSPQIGSSWNLQKGKDGFHITITIDKDWFLQSSNRIDKTYLSNLLKSDKPFYLFESMNPAVRNIILSIHKLINTDDNLQILKLHQKTIELFNLFVEKIEQRTLKEDVSGINAYDIDEIFKIRRQLLENLTNIPSLKELSLQAGMSISKMQKCFQQMFGKSIFQYALSEKMSLAKQLLDTKKYSVSEVGYELGYSNLSHFSKAFNKEFKINPKTYLLNNHP